MRGQRRARPRRGTKLDPGRRLPYFSPVSASRELKRRNFAPPRSRQPALAGYTRSSRTASAKDSDSWVKVKNPAAPAVTREAEEEWN